MKKKHRHRWGRWMAWLPFRRRGSTGKYRARFCEDKGCVDVFELQEVFDNAQRTP